MMGRPQRIGRERKAKIMSEAYIVDYIRTPIGRFGGALSAVRADDLAAAPLRALMERNPSIDFGAVDDVIYGCANQAGEGQPATSPAWRCCWPECRKRCRARRSTACAAPAWTRRWRRPA